MGEVGKVGGGWKMLEEIGRDWGWLKEVVGG